MLDIFLKQKAVCTDTRQIIPNSIFFALKGPNFNANEFAKNALEQGCAFAVIDESAYAEVNDSRYIIVGDSLKALQNLASDYRDFLKIPILGITGSNGKTTTKEILHAVLSKKMKCFATPGNLNNHIGVPLSILKIEPDCEIAIIEMGDNKLGDVKELCEIAKPNYGIITNVGKDHIEGFGSFENNIKAKIELYDYLQLNEGNVFVKNNDDLLLKASEKFSNRKVYGSMAEYGNIQLAQSNPYVCYTYQNKTYESKLVGEYNIDNFSCAIAVGEFFNLSANDITNAIAAYEPKNNRSQLIETANNSILLDAYNANPSSMELAIESFSKLQTEKSKLLILGDMLELGHVSNEEHQNIIDLLKKKTFNRVFLVGKEFGKTTYGAYLHFNNTQELKDFLQKNPTKKHFILLKGSRGIKLESIVEYL